MDDTLEPLEPTEKQNLPQRNPVLFSKEHMVAFYTLLAVLLRMKKDLGLEVMLEYMTLYLKAIDSHNPKIAMAVSKILDIIPIEVLYHELGNSRQNE